jgi:hypothetical protein
MDCNSARVTGVKFRCTKRPPGGYWKAIVQSRSDGLDGHNGKGTFTFTGCWIIGPHEVGRQKDPGGNGQQVGLIVYDGCFMEYLPRVSSVNGKSGVKSLVIKNCKKIDNKGKIIGAWPDQTTANPS